MSSSSFESSFTIIGAKCDEKMAINFIKGAESATLQRHPYLLNCWLDWALKSGHFIWASFVQQPYRYRSFDIDCKQSWCSCHSTKSSQGQEDGLHKVCHVQAHEVREAQMRIGSLFHNWTAWIFDGKFSKDISSNRIVESNFHRGQFISFIVGLYKIKYHHIS